ncbi:MAG: Eco57I restriction-modification methylase [Firmicutes bacterium ADurb.BinA205]|nr:MAG: Eco57I restriction-modification methylase [Firmicutes bacterium ADurb.BinA205]
MSNKVKVSKENIAAATQLFTPDWIVRYMVENSLGRLWVDGHADTSARSEWKYYLDEAEQTPEVQAQLAEIRAGRKDLTPEQIRFIDPCMGSGHILVYAFDVLMQIYLSCGYTERDAAQNIVRNNLWGLDLDKRAYQLAYFAVMMKARQYDRRFLTRGIKPNLSHFQDLPIVNYSLLDEPIKSFMEQFENADTYGSLITVQADDEIDKALDDFQGTLDLTFGHMEHLMQLYKILSQRYDVVCTNPPYMGSSNMNGLLVDYLKTNYPDSKSDFFAAFIERGFTMAKTDGYNCMVTMQAWMFLSSYETMRKKLLATKTIANLMHMENMVMGIAFGTAVTSFFNSNVNEYRGTYNHIKYCDIEENIPKEFPVSNNRFAQVSSDLFSKIPCSPIAYWISSNFAHAFEHKNFSERFTSGGRNKTHNNEKYVRMWWEIIDRNRWQGYSNGGDYRKWYGDNIDVVDWSESARAFYGKHGGLLKESLWNVPAITWNDITSGKSSYRIKPVNSKYSSVSPTLIGNTQQYDYTMLGFLNSIVCEYMNEITNPTIHTLVGNILLLPDMLENVDVNDVVQDNIDISKSDWDSFETSWDFKEHPFVKWSKELWDATAIGATMQHYYGDHPKASCPLELCYLLWQGECNDRRAKLKANEEELNRIFIEIYGLQDELTPEVEDKDITIRAADLQRDMRSFVSYAVGCMFGRYSLDTEGLAYAGGEWDESKYKTFIPDKDNCLPITEEHFFEDDIVTQFVNFVQAVFGEDTLEDNLRYVAENLGIKGNGTAREKIRQYFLKEFYKDHCKVYQKRPIYWLFDTGKKNGFKALCYIHRWTVNTVGDVRIDYMHKLQRLYRNEIIRLQEKIDNGEEIAKSQKRLEKITNQLKETEDYDAKIGMVVAARTEIDLDDGVKVNYDKVQLGSDGKKYQILATI